MVIADLTNRRDNLLKHAKYQINNDPNISELVDYVYCDANCKMKVVSMSKKTFAFNSEIEFHNIVTRLDKEATATEEFLKDEMEGRPDLEPLFQLFY